MIFGYRASNISNFLVSNAKCSYCDQEGQRISVFGKYIHVMWIPLFPIGKKAVSECTHCKKTIAENEFSQKLRQLYWDNKDKAKTPFTHWIGLAILGGFIALITLIGITHEEDPRNKFLLSDVKAMTKNPTMESDSISYKIKRVFDSFSTEEIDPSEFQYLTKIKGDKALILVKIPNLKQVEKGARTEAIEMIEMITNNQEDLKGKEKYIGVHGKFNMMLLKTPTKVVNKRMALDEPLFEFYGPKPISEN